MNGYRVLIDCERNGIYFNGLVTKLIEQSMGSRFRNNVVHFFECFCEIVPPTADKAAWIIQQYPDNFDEQVLKSVPKFAYPYKFENTVVQHYSFVLTDLQSKFTCGFCRHDPKSQTALVVLSYLPWHQALYKFLDNIAVLMHSPRADDLRDFLMAVYKQQLPDPGRNISIAFNNGASNFSIDCPKRFQLPSIPENRNLTEYYNAVSAANMMVIFASMLFERRIIVTSRKLTRLSACVQSANDVIYPMNWQHIFIPVLPASLIDYMLAPMPFLIGVPEDVLQQVQRSEVGDVVILDADNDRIETPFDDLNSLPTEVVASLKKQLKNRAALLGDGVSRAFLRALVQLIGGYRDALIIKNGEKVTFNEQSFIDTRPASSQKFLKEMLHLQIFQQFIEERLEMLNNGQGFSDEFEKEACMYSDKSNSKLKQQYKEWTSSMKKEGSAFFKSVKEKANPAVKSAVKTVKDGGKGMKSAYKGLRSKLKDSPNIQFQNGIDTQMDKPRSAPNSPTGKRRSFGVPSTNFRKDGFSKNTQADRPYSPLSPNSQPVSPDFEERSRSASPEIVQYDLMNELQDLLNLPNMHLDTPPVDRSLKPVRSLENFKQHSAHAANSLLSQFTPSPDHSRWPTTPSRSTTPSTKLFYHHPPPTLPSRHIETQNLLLQSPDDVFSSPPPIPVPNLLLEQNLRLSERAPATNGKDLFGAAPFVVGSGRVENGHPVFLLADRKGIDVVKLSPPRLSGVVAAVSPGRKKRGDTEDLIRLNSSSDLDEFDPLNQNPNSELSASLPNSRFYIGSAEQSAPLSLCNPLYNYENHHVNVKQSNGNDVSGKSATAEGGGSGYSAHEQDLLKEYGIDLNKFNFQGFSDTGSGKVKSQNQWTKFD